MTSPKSLLERMIEKSERERQRIRQRTSIQNITPHAARYKAQFPADRHSHLHSLMSTRGHDVGKSTSNELQVSGGSLVLQPDSKRPRSVQQFNERWDRVEIARAQRNEHDIINKPHTQSAPRAKSQYLCPTPTYNGPEPVFTPRPAAVNACGELRSSPIPCYKDSPSRTNESYSLAPKPALSSRNALSPREGLDRASPCQRSPVNPRYKSPYVSSVPNKEGVVLQCEEQVKMPENGLTRKTYRYENPQRVETRKRKVIATDPADNYHVSEALRRNRSPTIEPEPEQAEPEASHVDTEDVPPLPSLPPLDLAPSALSDSEKEQESFEMAESQVSWADLDEGSIAVLTSDAIEPQGSHSTTTCGECMRRPSCCRKCCTGLAPRYLELVR